MSLRERIIESLGGHVQEDPRRTYTYIDRISKVDLPEETPLINVRSSEELERSLNEAELTKGQRAGISKILSDCNWIPDSHKEITIGEIRRMSDEELGNLGSDIGRGWRAGDRTKAILRKLFG